MSRIMDCVSCEKCRLWGKIQITGLGTALKILFSFNGLVLVIKIFTIKIIIYLILFLPLL